MDALEHTRLIADLGLLDNLVKINERLEGNLARIISDYKRLGVGHSRLANTSVNGLKKHFVQERKELRMIQGELRGKIRVVRRNIRAVF